MSPASFGRLLVDLGWTACVCCADCLRMPSLQRLRAPVCWSWAHHPCCRCLHPAVAARECAHPQTWCEQVLCECSSLQQPDAAATWGKLLQALLAYLDGQSTQGAAGSEADADEGTCLAFGCVHSYHAHQRQPPCLHAVTTCLIRPEGRNLAGFSCVYGPFSCIWEMFALF